MDGRQATLSERRIITVLLRLATTDCAARGVEIRTTSIPGVVVPLGRLQWRGVLLCRGSPRERREACPVPVAGDPDGYWTDSTVLVLDVTIRAELPSTILRSVHTITYNPPVPRPLRRRNNTVLVPTSCAITRRGIRRLFRGRVTYLVPYSAVLLLQPDVQYGTYVPQANSNRCYCLCHPHNSTGSHSGKRDDPSAQSAAINDPAALHLWTTGSVGCCDGILVLPHGHNI